MNSSTSSSEPRTDPGASDPVSAAAWRRFLLLVPALGMGLALVLWGLALALDPYDTGILGLVHHQGTFAKGPRVGHASRVHDEAFDAALIGNSHVMALAPERLSAETGLRFVMLGIPGTGVEEQMRVLDAFLDRHSPPKALIVSVDPLYCLDDPRSVPAHPFPDWLYARSRIAYGLGLARMSTLEAMGRRLGLLAGWTKPQRRDGTMDVLAQPSGPDRAADAERVAGAPVEDLSQPPQTHRPGIAMLRDRLRRLAPSTRVVLLLPPVAARTLPPPQTPAWTAGEACKAAIAALADAHANLAVVDWHVERPETRDPANFYDSSHYYDALARQVERDVAGALGR